MLQILRSLAKCRCSMCKLVLTAPVHTPCGHQFCKGCLETKYAAEAPTDCSARPLRTRKQRKPCPECNKDLADFMEGSSFQVSTHPCMAAAPILIHAFSMLVEQPLHPHFLLLTNCANYESSCPNQISL